MRENEHPRYVPRELSERLRLVLGDERIAELGHGDGLWRLDRLLEEAFAAGYSQGHNRGWAAGWEAGRHVGRSDHRAEVAAELQGLREAGAAVVAAWRERRVDPEFGVLLGKAVDALAELLPPVEEA